MKAENRGHNERIVGKAEVAEVMGRLISEGMICGWGMSMVNAAYLKRVQDITPLTAVQNIYSMMDRAYERGVIPYCLEHHIGFVPFSLIASGYLSGKVNPDQKFYGQRSDLNVPTEFIDE